MAGASGLGLRHPLLKLVADRHGVSSQRVALAWLLSKSPNVIPIPGARRPATIIDSLLAETLVLTPDDLELLGQE